MDERPRVDLSALIECTLRRFGRRRPDNPLRVGDDPGCKG